MSSNKTQDATKKKLHALFPNLDTQFDLLVEPPEPYTVGMVQTAMSYYSLSPQAVTDISNAELDDSKHAEDAKGRPFCLMAIQGDAFVVTIYHNRYGWKSSLLWTADGSTKEISYRAL